MPAFFVWARPSLVVVIQAASEQDAAEVFMKLPVTTKPERSSPPDCFVEFAPEYDAPQVASSVSQFWVAVKGLVASKVE